jgi:hypothetical protein
VSYVVQEWYQAGQRVCAASGNWTPFHTEYLSSSNRIYLKKTRGFVRLPAEWQDKIAAKVMRMDELREVTKKCERFLAKRDKQCVELLQEHVRESHDIVRHKLESLNLSHPKSFEDWQRLAITVNMPHVVMQTLNFTPGKSTNTCWHG